MMAIVQFVSDKGRLLFVDIEVAGKASPDSMLKVTLGFDSCLI